MKIPDDDWKKLSDDYKRIAEAFEVVKIFPDKNGKLFNVTMDLLMRELDRLFLDINQILK